MIHLRTLIFLLATVLSSLADRKLYRDENTSGNTNQLFGGFGKDRDPRIVYAVKHPKYEGTYGVPKERHWGPLTAPPTYIWQRNRDDGLGSGGSGSGSLGSGGLGPGRLASGVVGSDSLGSGGLVVGSLGSEGLGSGDLGSGNLGSGGVGSGNLGSGGLESGSFGSGGSGSGNLGSGGLGSGSFGFGDVEPEVWRLEIQNLEAGRYGSLDLGAGGSGVSNLGAGGSGVSNLGAGGSGVSNLGAGGSGGSNLGAGGSGGSNLGAGASGGSNLRPEDFGVVWLDRFNDRNGYSERYPGDRELCDNNGNSNVNSNVNTNVNSNYNQFRYDPEKAMSGESTDDDGSPERLVIINNNYNVAFKGNRRFGGFGPRGDPCKDRSSSSNSNVNSNVNSNMMGPKYRRNWGPLQKTYYVDKPFVIGPQTTYVVDRPPNYVTDHQPTDQTGSLVMRSPSQPRPYPTKLRSRAEDYDKGILGSNMNSNTNNNYLGARRSNINTNSNFNQILFGGRKGPDNRDSNQPNPYRPKLNDNDEDDDISDNVKSDSKTNTDIKTRRNNPRRRRSVEKSLNSDRPSQPENKENIQVSNADTKTKPASVTQKSKSPRP